MTGSPSQRFSVLGPVRAWAGEAEIDLGPRQRRAVLALLLAKAGEPVAVPELVDLIWPLQPPPTAVNIVHRHIGELRRLIEPCLPPRAEGRWLCRHSTGYRFGGAGGTLDLDEFRQLVDRAGEERDIQGYVRALDLVRGRCAEGQQSGPARHPAFSLIDAEVMGAVGAAVDLAVTAEETALLLPAVRRVADLYSLDEDAWSALQALPARVGSPPMPGQAGAVGEVSAREQTHRLPAAPHGFVGREANLRRMDQVIDDLPRTAGLVAVTGMPGLGKTALAIRWAHRVADRFPDGLFFVELRGSEQESGLLTAADAIHCLLRALGVPADQIPASYPARVGLFRTVVVGRRALFVLDDARDAEHVLGLLPGAPGSAALVTSRDRLGELAVRGAHLAALDLLEPTEARQALRGLIGGARFAADPEMRDAVIACCAGLPRAIALAGARMAAGENPRADLEGIFAQPFRSLSVAAQRLLRSMATGVDSFSLTRFDPAIERLVRELTTSGLLVERRPGRFVLHGLLRAYAVGLS